jgi:hypothetical protein
MLVILKYNERFNLKIRKIIMSRYTRRSSKFPSGCLSNPVYVVYEYKLEHISPRVEKKTIIKVCKSMQTVKKYMINSKNPTGYAGWSMDFYSEEMLDLLKIGNDLTKLELKIEMYKLP